MTPFAGEHVDRRISERKSHRRALRNRPRPSAVRALHLAERWHASARPMIERLGASGPREGRGACGNFVSGHSLPDMSKAKPYLASRTMLHVISSRIAPTA